jgi:hypothetical protein
MSKEIDLLFRPKSYFRPEKLEKYLLSKVKGEVLHKELGVLFEAGQYDDVLRLVGNPSFYVSDHKVLELIHPIFTALVIIFSKVS